MEWAEDIPGHFLRKVLSRDIAVFQQRTGLDFNVTDCSEIFG
jgi:hypothetical protein